MFVPDPAASSAAAHPAAAPPAAAAERKGVWVVQPGAAVQGSSGDWLERAFFDLFPYGCGGPADPRRQVQVSTTECYAHYLRTGYPEFLRSDFALHTYDMKARQDMNRTAFVSARVPTNQAHASANTSNAQVRVRFCLPCDHHRL